jgi:hypothetical protein
LSRAARVGTSPLPGMGTRPDDRPSLQGLDSGTTGDTQHSSQGTKGLQTGDNGSKGNIFKKDEEQTERSAAIEEQEQILEQSQLAAGRAADLPPTPTPSSPAASTTTVPSPAAPTLPDVSPAVTTTLGSGEVTMIGAYFAQHGAPVSSVPTSSVNVSVGGTVPDSVALFPPPYDLVNQVSDPDFSYFVSGQNVVIVDGQTNVVSARARSALWNLVPGFRRGDEVASKARILLRSSWRASMPPSEFSDRRTHERKDQARQTLDVPHLCGAFDGEGL